MKRKKHGRLNHMHIAQCTHSLSNDIICDDNCILYSILYRMHVELLLPYWEISPTNPNPDKSTLITFRSPFPVAAHLFDAISIDPIFWYFFKWNPIIIISFAALDYAHCARHQRPAVWHMQQIAADFTFSIFECCVVQSWYAQGYR